jgi:glycosidase
VPLSLAGQLQYIREKWAHLLGDYLDRLLGGLDLLKEEEKPAFAGPGPSMVVDFSGLDFDAESARYSADRDWMPRLVMVAKSTYVWLDQLSKKYQRPIASLDQIPDEELDTLARWGFSGLWLIGLWERSRASQLIKQMMGNPEAVASAYSLFDYQIAADLGGEAAYRNLAGRAWRRGMRLASDMVPNHMGIDSMGGDYPDWFVGLDYSPFPYTFNGPDLSSDGRVGIFLEDHYYNHSDAAVVFKRLDRWTGSARYIYHGNDGTSMPWNDTAQLDYLNPAVCEAVIQTILEVARRFPVIRFDAAMTLAKRHVQRLWFPVPGTGGAIASRSEYGMPQAQFDAAMPAEFWREVVERVAQEVPDTLLLAEAFWMMEGYFVRTLGMHRVYNSAFMNMLKREENAKYRSSIKNVLEFDPEILKRYVNFMNNPDEETAVAQFGKDDKYFGVCAMMVTMPGLPMIGHCQVEGYREKYGMEYRRAYWDEQPDMDLVRRHEREIFPLMQRRYIFADVKNFLLYDFYTPEGHVNEDVFAYSNAAPTGERGLVLYNNKYAEARGWIRTRTSVQTEAATPLVQKTWRGSGPAGR